MKNTVQYLLCFPTLCLAVCPRLYFKGLDPTRVPYIQTEGTYTLKDETHDNFPVFTHGTTIRLLYNRTTRDLEFKSDGHHIQFGAHTRELSGNLADYIQDGEFPFGRIITNWFVNDGEVSGLTLMCVAGEMDRFHKCGSRMLYWNDTSQVEGLLGNKLHYIIEFPGYFLRPLYQFSPEGSMYLFYLDTMKAWYFGAKIMNTDGAILRVVDTAFRAEHITGIWQKNVRGRWVDVPRLALFCRGLANSECDQCLHSARCYTNSLREAVCVCPEGYEGLRCDVKSPQCGDLPTLHNQEYATTFCDQSLYKKPHWWYSVCHAQGANRSSARWVNYGRCMSRFTTTTSTVPTSTAVVKETTRVVKKQGLDVWQQLDATAPWCVAVFASVSIAFQIVVPLVIWVVMTCVGSEDRTDLTALINTFESYLDYNYEVDNDDTLRIMQQDFEEQVKRKQAGMSPSFGRISSAVFYVSVYLWLGFALTCEITEWTRKSEAVKASVVISHLLIFVLHVYVVIQAFWCRERKLMKQLSTKKRMDQVTQSLKSSQPEILMSAKCWHWSSRIRSSALRPRSRGSRGKAVSSLVIEPVSLKSWTDASRDISPKRRIVKGSVYGIVAAGDAHAATHVVNAYHNFQERYVNRDKFVEFSINRGVTKLPKKVVLFGDVPWWLGEKAFWVFTIFGLSWPFRLFLKLHCQDEVVLLVKRVFIDALHGNHAFDVSPMVVEEEGFVRETQVLVADDHHTSDLDSESSVEEMENAV
ncbi:hypothetical protein CAPTEDRAFT_194504 [Capitella teleta]|uniref:EGF-like domain-containing protein n=1 Tax=Capitella teleta TaxID=283909 RepID=R7T6H1_CAPTE|nr:hypothetical protein CAPTEDRAFT_194504 [Capitella teleta]|eukprot:ELT89164.1 hypothetical protein CAPTEDRAFT_194504 [Capitella teleta]